MITQQGRQAMREQLAGYVRMMADPDNAWRFDDRESDFIDDMHTLLPALLAYFDEAEKRIVELRGALSELLDVQNGPPLISYTNAWNAAVERANAALGEDKELEKRLEISRAVAEITSELSRPGNVGEGEDEDGGAA